MSEIGQQTVEQIAEKVNKNASPQVVGVWSKHAGLLKGLEKWVQTMKETIEKAKKRWKILEAISIEVRYLLMGKPMVRYPDESHSKDLDGAY